MEKIKYSYILLVSIVNLQLLYSNKLFKILIFYYFSFCYNFTKIEYLIEVYR
jgi:hypothetical protein